MSKTIKKMKEMAEVFKRKSGPHIRPFSRIREEQEWKREWEREARYEKDDN